jgi:hypothetical protein
MRAISLRLAFVALIFAGCGSTGRSPSGEVNATPGKADGSEFPLGTYRVNSMVEPGQVFIMSFKSNMTSHLKRRMTADEFARLCGDVRPCENSLDAEVEYRFAPSEEPNAPSATSIVLGREDQAHKMILPYTLEGSLLTIYYLDGTQQTLERAAAEHSFCMVPEDCGLQSLPEPSGGWTCHDNFCAEPVAETACSTAGGRCTNNPAEDCRFGVIGSPDLYGCGETAGLQCCMSEQRCAPRCTVGADGPGWYTCGGRLLCSVPGCAESSISATCQNIGTETEAWYSPDPTLVCSGDNGMVWYANCGR